MLRREITKKHFTLLELMYVIAALFVLVAILIPALGRTMEVARRIACGNQLRQIGLGYQHYFNDHDMFPKTYRFLEDFNPIASYVNSKQVFRCPSSFTEVIEDDELWYMNNDYLFSPGNLRDVEETSASNEGYGNNPYDFDPSNTSAITTAIIDEKRTDKVLYDRHFPAHLNDVNMVIIGDLHYEVMYGVNTVWVLDNDYRIIRTLEPYPDPTDGVGSGSNNGISKK